jgi:hypothetical protein
MCADDLWRRAHAHRRPGGLAPTACVFSAVRWALTQFETEIADELLGTYGGPRRPYEDGEEV